MALASARPFIIGWDESETHASYAGGTNFDQSPGNLEISDFGAHVLLCDELHLTDTLTFQPALDFSSTILRFNDVPTSILIDKNNLQSFSVYPFTIGASGLFCWTRPNTPWMFGAWTRSGMATDSRSIDSDDLAIDLAVGTAYRFSETLSCGVGAAVTDLSGNKKFYPGVGLDWQINDLFQVSLCGNILAMNWMPEEDWQISLRAYSAGENWNIYDDQGRSRDIDLRTYQIGLFINRRIFGNVSIGIGGGITFGNEISLDRTNGDELLKQGLDSGLFGAVRINLAIW